MAEEAPPPRQPKRKRTCVVCDEVKERHTSHWDMDTLSHAELEEQFSEEKNPPPIPSWLAYLRSYGWTVLVFGTLALVNSLLQSIKD